MLPAENSACRRARQGGVLKKGGVQHTTVGRGCGIRRSTIARTSRCGSSRCVLSGPPGLDPAVEQKAIEQADRTNAFLPLVSNTVPGALRIVSDAASSHVSWRRARGARRVAPGGAPISMCSRRPVLVNGEQAPALASVMITDEREIKVNAEDDAELLLVDVKMKTV